MAESYFLYQFLAFWKVETVPPESYFVYHLKGPFLTCEGGTVPNTLGGTVSNSLFALCFPIFGTNYGIVSVLSTAAGELVAQGVLDMN